MRSFIDSRAQPNFFDSTSSGFAPYAKMNADDKATFNNEETKTEYFDDEQDEHVSAIVESSASANLAQVQRDVEDDSPEMDFAQGQLDDEDDDGPETDVKKMKRVLANRRSARESYQRRKRMFSELETAVTSLTKDNTDLVEENKKLKLEIVNLHQQRSLSLLPVASMPTEVGAGMTASGLALQQLATGQQQALPSQQLPLNTLTQQQQQMAQQQGELDQLLELILRGRQA